jgi:hypothetical protein
MRTSHLFAALVLAATGSMAMAADASASSGTANAPSASSPTPKLTRAQVRAETVEAIRLGLIPQPAEVMPARVATPEEAEMIRQAGLRAIGKADTTVVAK